LPFLEKPFCPSFRQPENYLHQFGKEYEPKAHLPVPRSLDLCFISKEPIGTVIAELQKHNCLMVEGPVERTGTNKKNKFSLCA